MITIVTIIKGIAKLAQKLPKFTKWVDDFLKRGGKGARKVGIITALHLVLLIE